MQYVISYDFGTTGVKTCLFGIDSKIHLLKSAYRGYALYILPDGGAEQDADEWWDAMCSTTKDLLQNAPVSPDEISGISFCSQMQGMVLVDREGNAVRRPMSYMDQRAGKVMEEVAQKGITVSGVNLRILLRSLQVTGAASTSVKDPLWKFKWVEANEPEVYAKAYKWLDVKEYLICRCSGKFVMTRDSAYATFLYDTRKGKEGWNKDLCRLYHVDMDKLPDIIECTDVAGELTAAAAGQLGLIPGTKVYGGGGDATLIGLGAGCTEVGQTHIYSGTSGWVETITDHQVVDIVNMIGAIVGAQPGKFNYFAEMETAGKCFEWIRDHLVLDEVNAYLEKQKITDSKEAVYESLYDYMSEIAGKVNPGANGVIFTPWLHGNRCPFEDPNAAGMFFNLRVENGKSDMIRAVLEGVCYHLRWMLECEEKKVRTSDPIRFVGGGALSRVSSQILADITGHAVETVENTKDVGAIGAALLVAVGSGTIPSFSVAGDLVRIVDRFEPDPEKKAIYDRNFKVFKKLYQSNKENFAILNGLDR